MNVPVAHRENVGERCGVVFALDAAPMSKDMVAGIVAAMNGAQHDGHAFAGLDVAVIDDVASARRCTRVEKPEEHPRGAVDERLEAREIKEVRAVEVL